MDWPLAGVTVAIVAVAGLSTYGLVTYMQSAPDVPKKQVVSTTALVPSTALPLYLSAAPDETSRVFRLNSFTDPGERPESESSSPTIGLAAPTQRPDLSQKRQQSRDNGNIPNGPSGLNSMPGVAAKASPLPPPNAAALFQPTVVLWRATPTANASYFNLGGHINRAGVVDSLASSHLRDAFKAHKNFSKLPPDIRMHILTQNIDLCKIAQYRGLLGIEDKKLEEEQAVRFERVASTH
jgi:hypothetical protein